MGDGMGEVEGSECDGDEVNELAVGEERADEGGRRRSKAAPPAPSFGPWLPDVTDARSACAGCTFAAARLLRVSWCEARRDAWDRDRGWG